MSRKQAIFMYILVSDRPVLNLYHSKDYEFLHNDSPNRDAAIIKAQQRRFDRF